MMRKHFMKYRVRPALLTAAMAALTATSAALTAALAAYRYQQSCKNKTCVVKSRAVNL